MGQRRQQSEYAESRPPPGKDRNGSRLYGIAHGERQKPNRDPGQQKACRRINQPHLVAQPPPRQQHQPKYHQPEKWHDDGFGGTPWQRTPAKR